MKTKILGGIIFLFSFSAVKATILTVNNAPSGGAQYSQVNAAIASANNGDTIYIVGSTITYADASLSKPITLIGPGAFNQGPFGLAAKFNNVVLSNNSSNTSIYGISIVSGSLNLNNLSNLSNIVISNCHFPTHRLLLSGLQNSSNITIRNNIFSGGNASIEFGGNTGCFNIVIEHNIINGFINSLSILNAVVQNNVFYNPNVNGNAFAFFNACSNAIVKNNIFFNANPTAQISSSIFNNNLTYSTTTPFASLGGTNLDNVDPLFMNVPATGNYSSLYDLHLQASSPAINAGSDGNDIGYYGGIVQVNPSGELWNMPYIREHGCAKHQCGTKWECECACSKHYSEIETMSQQF